MRDDFNLNTILSDMRLEREDVSQLLAILTSELSISKPNLSDARFMTCTLHWGVERRVLTAREKDQLRECDYGALIHRRSLLYWFLRFE